jgi:mRNA-degrading endonuclease RelE of RelBE toxin-antitoxin system
MASRFIPTEPIALASPLQCGHIAAAGDSGYIMARMPYAVVLAPEAVRQLKALRAKAFAEIRDALEQHLRHEPSKISKSRIKRLRGLSQPQYRLRVGDYRVYYDVGVKTVEVLAIITKAQATGWLKEKGVPSEEGGASEG